MHVLALDPATATGVAYGEPGSTPKLWTEKFGGEGAEPEDIYEKATFFFADFLRTNTVDLFVIEGVVPPFGAMGRTTHNTTMITIGLYGIFVGVARCKRIPWRRVQIKAWRKHFLGRGDLNTETAKREALKRCRLLKWDPPDHNAAEAGGMFDWGCAQLNASLFGEMKW